MYPDDRAAPDRLTSSLTGMGGAEQLGSDLHCLGSVQRSVRDAIRKNRAYVSDCLVVKHARWSSISMAGAPMLPGSSRRGCRFAPQ